VFVPLPDSEEEGDGILLSGSKVQNNVHTRAVRVGRTGVRKLTEGRSISQQSSCTRVSTQRGLNDQFCKKAIPKYMP